jgi:hypothetical protein
MHYFRIRPGRPFTLSRCSPEDEARGTPPVFAYDFDTTEPIFKLARYVFVTRSCAAELRAKGLSGFRFEEIETLRSPEAEENNAALAQEAVAWLHVEGTAGQDDFGMQDRVNLIVSQSARSALEGCGMREAQIFDYDPAYRTPTVAELLAAGRVESEKKST